MLGWNEAPVDTWKDFEAKIDDVRFNAPVGSSLVFRGQVSHKFALQPSLLRGLPSGATAAQVVEVEKGLVFQFRQEAHHYIRQTVLPPDLENLDRFNIYFKWLTLMQHYGVPTRLLDWTTSPFVAAYFAVEDRWGLDGEPENGVVYYFDEIAVTRFFGLLDADFTAMPAAELTAANPKSCLYIGSAKLKSEREVIQQGCFSFSTNVLDRHDDPILNACHAAQPDRPCCGKVVIPAYLKAEFVWRLQTMNVTPKTLFPGADGIGRSMRDAVRMRWKWLA